MHLKKAWFWRPHLFFVTILGIGVFAFPPSAFSKKAPSTRKITRKIKITIKQPKSNAPLDCFSISNPNGPAVKLGIFLEPYTRVLVNEWAEIRTDGSWAAAGASPQFYNNAGVLVDKLGFGFAQVDLVPIIRVRPNAPGVYRLTMQHICPSVTDFHTIEVINPSETYPVIDPRYFPLSPMNQAFRERNSFGLSLFTYKNMDNNHAVMSSISFLKQPMPNTYPLPYPLYAPHVFQLSNSSTRFSNRGYGSPANCFEKHFGQSTSYFQFWCAKQALQNLLHFSPSLDFYNNPAGSTQMPVQYAPGVAYGTHAVGGHEEGAASSAELGALDAAASALSLLPLDSALALFKKAILSTWVSETLRRGQVRAVESGSLSDVYHISLDSQFNYPKIQELAEAVTPNNLPLQMRGEVKEFTASLQQQIVRQESRAFFNGVVGKSNLDVNTAVYSLITLHPFDDVISFTVDLQKSFIPNSDGSEITAQSSWTWKVYETEDSIRVFRKDVQHLGSGIYRVSLTRDPDAEASTPGGRITLAFTARDSEARQVPPYFLNIYSDYHSESRNLEMRYFAPQVFPSLFPRIRMLGSIWTEIPLARMISLNDSQGRFTGVIVVYSYYGPDGYGNLVTTWIDRGLSTPLLKLETPVYNSPSLVTYRDLYLGSDYVYVYPNNSTQSPLPEILYSPYVASLKIDSQNECVPSSHKWFVEHTTLPRSQVTFQLSDPAQSSRVRIIADDYTRTLEFNPRGLSAGVYEIPLTVSAGSNVGRSKLIVNMAVSCPSFSL